MTEDWQLFVKKIQQDHRDSRIPVEWKIPSAVLAEATDLDVIHQIPTHLSPRELEITGKTAAELVRLMASGSLTSVEVTRELCHRASVAQQYLCCITEVLFDQALKRAQECDDYFKATGRKTLGPLHDLPISIKEEHAMKGTFVTWGFVEWAREGPSALISFETNNVVWGKTLNPFNLKAVPGGSTSGEGCLIAVGSSPLGVSGILQRLLSVQPTQVHRFFQFIFQYKIGSIRVPSSINGLYSLKPSTRRFAYNGSKVPFIGAPDAVLPVNGPIARSVDDIELYTLVQYDIEGWRIDLNVIQRQCVKPELPKKLRVGYILDNGIRKPVGPVERAIRSVVAGLEKAGHMAVEVDFKSGCQLMELTINCYKDSVVEIVKKRGEGVTPSLAPHFVHSRPNPDAGELWPKRSSRDSNLDFIIAPVIGLPSYPHDRSFDAVAAGSYTMAFNLLYLPVGIVAITTITPADKPTEKYVARHRLEQVVVGRRGFEEWVIECMKVVDKAH
ncbi:amidase signature enzyme [Gonapodya prolifera JEL478]|uniref:Amidase signature enzyme n=1 Tax=Gonapodya prolifera (strain JEL478) TaxID=1344416 RepID=A0A139APG5_GONPJ|nr:amidase signature enzyme [Gonapodya prolifera JEL478]|eukprot:KXS18647.1 amidase signature enzyme [Gonapodya prolifera JEL478]